MTSLDLNQPPRCIEYPTLNVDFELKSGLIHLFPTFRGLAGLTEANRSLVDAANRGALYEKTPTEARKLFITMTANNQQFRSRSDNLPQKVNEWKELNSKLVVRGHAQQGKVEEELEIPTKQTEEPDQVNNDIPKVFVTKPPFPERFAKAEKGGEERKIFETFCKVEVNIQLLDAIKQLPRYTKFLKELCTNKAIGWTIADIKGLSPSTCMHRILLEEGAKPSGRHNVELNLPMMEVVKKEILKFLDAGHIVSSRVIEVDQAKIDVIKSILHPTIVREIRSFLGHAGFYRRFIKDFSKIAQPLCKLLQKDEAFEFDETSKLAFNKLKESLTSTPIIQPQNWELSFEIICDARNHAIGAVLGQRIGRNPHVIYYVSRMLDSTHRNYSTVEKELLAIIFALEKFHPYLLVNNRSRLTPLKDEFLNKRLLAAQGTTP
ncbi:Retrovirus-related Pol polyprotein from transposon, partial [Sesamum angolense]